MFNRSVKAKTLPVLKAAMMSTALFVAGCGPLISFGDDGPADEVYNLRYDGSYSANIDSEYLVYLEEPLMSQHLSGVDVAVTLSGDKTTTLDGVRWSANSSDLIRDYLVRALSDKSGVKMLGEGGLDVQAGCRMTVKVWSFEFNPAARSRDDAVSVAIEFSLVRYRGSELLGQRAFTVDAPVSGSQSQAVIDGFRSGIRDLASEAAEWLKPLGQACKL